MANEGYIKLYRRMMKWGWYTDPATKVVFLHLLLVAAHEPWEYRGIPMEAGQAVTTVAQIAGENGLTTKQVRTALNHLKTSGEVAIKGQTKYSVITIKNYRKYQVYEASEVNKGQTEGKQEANKGQTKGKPSDNKKLRKREAKNIPPYNPPKGDGAQKRFVPPTVAEVSAYCLERDNGIDPEAFVAYYEAAGWMRGKSKISDWRAAVRTWERKRREEQPAPPKQYRLVEKPQAEFDPMAALMGGEEVKLEALP